MDLSAEIIDSKKKSSPPCRLIDFYQKYISDLRYGNCRFNPSCSQYAKEAIGARGFIKGSVIAADRLVRCHSGAYRYYARDAEGHLADPVAGRPGATDQPIIPSWLLPDRDRLIITMSYIFSDRQIEYAAFADELAEEGDCWRAATEYRRVAFLCDSGELDYWSRMMTGTCHFRWDDWEEARLEYLDAAAVSQYISRKNAAYFMAAASDFNLGLYGRCADTLRKCDFDVITDTDNIIDIDQAQFLRGLCAMALGKWNEGSQRFEAIARVYPDSPYRDKALFLSKYVGLGVDIRRKNAKMAVVFSTLLPGSGQMYAGRAYDGFRHFLFDGLLVYSVYSLIKEENYAPGYLLGGFTLPFYFGNIIGAKNSAEKYNVTRRHKFISTLMQETSAQ